MIEKFQIGDKVKIIVDSVMIGAEEYIRRPYKVPKGDIRVVIGYAKSVYDGGLVYKLNSNFFNDLSGIGFREDEILKV